MLEGKKIRNQLKFLTIYAFVSSILIVLLLFLVVKINSIDSSISESWQSDSIHVPHLTAERIDIVEPDRNLAIALSNSKTSAKLRFDGQILNGSSNRNIPNIIFFDGKGDEVGGLGFANFVENDEGFKAIRHLAFDGYRQDEVITLSHFVRQGSSRKGLYIYDRSEIPIMDALKEAGVRAEDTPEILGEKLNQFKEENLDRYQEIWSNSRRVAVQTNEENEAQLILADSKGNIRLQLLVKPDGKAFIEFLDENGMVVKKLEP
jgi:hypothetical protein